MIRVLGRSSLHATRYPNLSFQLHPEERERSPRIGLQLFPFFAGIICEENKTALIEAFEQNDAHEWFAIRSGGGETHRVRIANSCIRRIGKPQRELPNRIRIKIGTAQSLGGVVETQPCNVNRRSIQGCVR